MRLRYHGSTAFSSPKFLAAQRDRSSGVSRIRPEEAGVMVARPHKRRASQYALPECLRCECSAQSWWWVPDTKRLTIWTQLFRLGSGRYKWTSWHWRSQKGDLICLSCKVVVSRKWWSLCSTNRAYGQNNRGDRICNWDAFENPMSIWGIPKQQPDVQSKPI
jgi:hypothetical protein